MAAPPIVKVIPERSVFLICDVQTRFRPAVANFDKVVMTTNKMLKIAKVIGVPIIVTEQNPLVDSAKPNFKMFAGTIKEEKDRTREVLQAMLPLKSGFYSQSYF
ncbi:hypothetical protein EW026_g2823 [Hermanssonia centrifuga]|uniref:Isochorismatase-like domain-containing protein n=1 Tax=Hermanssonia centrifuga TaxID=98765 RepID=A0A4S4KP00_9APHY|nr:hypothetical protein EW026_g2823 [Hermanssonia centrifuga]